MIIAPEIDPIAVALGPLAIRWYGLMYLVGFIGGGLLGSWRCREGRSSWVPQDVWDLLFYIAIGVVLGGRLGYALFYNAGYYVSNPMEILQVWSGGMSFHGGLIGVILSLWLFARNRSRSFLDVADFVAPLVPLGLFAGRIGNFINQELWGRVTDVPWAMVFRSVDELPRHPSQLYEAALEGLLLFIVLWWFSVGKRRPGQVAGLFMTGYALARFFVEFFREPDLHLGAVALNWLTMGQLLSIPMAMIGLWLLLRKSN